MGVTSINIDQTKARNSIKILYNHIKKNPSNEDQVVWLIITTMNTILTSREKVAMIPLKHSLQKAGTRRCLFSRDPQQKYKDLLISQKVKGIHKVISISKFKKQHGSKEGRQQLLDQYDIFLVTDKGLWDRLPRVLGKQLFKQITPLLLNMEGTDIQKEVIRSIHSTYMNFRKGDCHSIKIALTSHTSQQAYENIMNAIDSIVAALPGGVENLRSLFIKTADSTSLPIYEYVEE
ncbi:ribosomal protein L1/ribosomal biogenesis protein [Halteromyces radiatus]|uniref:ribosomal protein L1/ribosomal biogenesis protein n=1 Tax=Halteromyces radiatus TaxID=101107 RepID=UPI002220172F|nr:ribosomal protein L1/ribosomal biogenesis protein [Halteromyces radiatus]KAI8093196.1 ribosomal protein L1/ribosomal biogenesis protein [Halteromyces radiatus]